MKLLVALLLIISPLAALGQISALVDALDICQAEILMLKFGVPLILTNGSIVSSSTCVKIYSRGLEISEGAFDTVPNLRYLDLTENDIHPRNLFSFGDLSNVEVLKLGKQGQSYYSGSATVSGVYPKLRYLDLSSANIDSIRYSQGGNSFPNLSHLDISDNYLQQSTMDFLPNSLEYLDLCYNKISQLQLANMPNLVSLKLDWNQITEINNYGLGLRGLENLENLSIANNRISSINNEQMKTMLRLRHLNLANNSLEQFLDFRVLQSLERLVLDGNSYSEVQITAPMNLTALSLNCNNIKYLTVTSFDNLPHLKSLSLSNNLIANVHADTFRNLEMLEELYLDGNQLGYLPADWCASMTKLRYLDLSRNIITAIESVICDYVLPVEHLYLTQNPIKSISAAAVRNIHNNMTIHLNVNSDFRRSCSSSKMLDYEY